MSDGFRCPHPKDCKYSTAGTRNADKWGCQYSDVTGRTKHRRNERYDIRQCKYYEPGPKVKLITPPLSMLPRPVKPEENARLHRGPQYDWEKEAVPLWEKGATDAEVAEALGCSLHYAGKMRLRLGLPCRRERSRRFEKQDGLLAGEMYKAGLNDEQISAALGFAPPCIRNWRKEQNLPAQGRRISDQQKARQIAAEIIERVKTDGQKQCD